MRSGAVIRRPADYKSAIQQAKSLRYSFRKAGGSQDCDVHSPRFEPRGSVFTSLVLEG
jgi:hypothetical protein